MPQEETGADIAAGGQSQESEDPEHGAGVHSLGPQGAGGPAQAEGDEPRQQWLPASAKPGPGVLKLTKTAPQKKRKDLCMFFTALTMTTRNICLG